MNNSLHIPSPLLLVNIPARRNREPGEMETAIPAERKPLFRGMETGHQCAYNVVMRFAQIHYGRSVYDPLQRDSAIATGEQVNKSK